jgi:hypothetical protein
MYARVRVPVLQIATSRIFHDLLSGVCMVVLVVFPCELHDKSLDLPGANAKAHHEYGLVLD